jgi:hypothetical protein
LPTEDTVFYILEQHRDHLRAAGQSHCSSGGAR